MTQDQRLSREAGSPPRAAASIRVLLVDDQLLFVESLRIVMETRARDIEIVAIARDGSSALQAVEEYRPDVVIMDVRMPGLDGVEATRIIHRKYPEIRIIMLTTFDDDDYVFQAIQHGAAGYLLKDMPPAELLDSIRLINRGHVMFSPAVASKITRTSSRSTAMPAGTEQADDDSVSPTVRYSMLSRREHEVFHLIVDGFDNREIAERLNLAEQTIKNHVSEIYAKMAVPDRLHLIRLAREIRFT